MQVHPNPTPKRPSHWKMKHYEFAGKVVGKCLYESALGNPLFVKARFTRSFLAQIIGLRINHKVLAIHNALTILFKCGPTWCSDLCIPHTKLFYRVY